MKVALGSDHGGYTLKEYIKEVLKEKGIKCEDFGTYSTESVDYPDFAEKVAGEVAAGKYDQGILCCGTGLGMSIAANKVPGIRAVVCGDCFSARMAREHNNANVLCMGERVVGRGLALRIVETWLEAHFLGDRHQRRVDKISEIEKKFSCHCK